MLGELGLDLVADEGIEDLAAVHAPRDAVGQAVPVARDLDRQEGAPSARQRLAQVFLGDRVDWGGGIPLPEQVAVGQIDPSPPRPQGTAPQAAVSTHHGCRCDACCDTSLLRACDATTNSIYRCAFMIT